MAGPPPKRKEVRQRWAKRAEIGLVASEPRDAVIPEPPGGLLKKSRETWESYWRSPVAQVATAADLPSLVRWITNVDEWHRAMQALRKERLVSGSTGQPVMNPLASYIASREAAIKDAEERFGMTPLSRVRLGIAVGQAKRTAAELNRALEQDDDGDRGRGDELEAEWEEAP